MEKRVLSRDYPDNTIKSKCWCHPRVSNSGSLRDRFKMGFKLFFLVSSQDRYGNLGRAYSAEYWFLDLKRFFIVYQFHFGTARE